MKDFAQTQVTLKALDDLQHDLLDKMETAKNWYNDYVDEFKDYSMIKDDEGNIGYFKRDTEGGNIDCSKWDYTYAENRVKAQEREIKAYQQIIDFLDGFKF